MAMETPQRAVGDMIGKAIEGETDYIAQTRGQRYIAINNATRAALDAMRQGAQKQQFDHGFFEPSYQALSKDFAKLQSAVQMIQANNIGVAGAGDAVAKTRKANPIVNAKLEKLSTDIGRSYWTCEVSRATSGKNLEDLSGF